MKFSAKNVGAFLSVLLVTAYASTSATAANAGGFYYGPDDPCNGTDECEQYNHSASITKDNAEENGYARIPASPTAVAAPAEAANGVIGQPPPPGQGK